MRLRENDLYLIELKLDRGLASEHGDDHADAVFVNFDLFHNSGEGTERTVEDPHGIANIVVDDDLALFDAHFINLVIGEGNGIITCGAYEAGDSSNAFDRMPGVVTVDHLNKNIAGIELPLIGLADA